MSTSSNHQSFGSDDRISQSLRNDRCQNILYKAVFEHFIELESIAALLLSSKSFQNSSFGANFIVNFVIDKDSIRILDSVLSPSSCFSLQFVPSLNIKQSRCYSEKMDRVISNFVNEIVGTKYLRLSLQSLTLHSVSAEFVSYFLGNATTSWPQLHDLSLENCGVDDAGLEIISNNAVQLRSLNLSRNLGITYAGLGHVSKKLSSITFLDLSYCNITDYGVQTISTLARIASLNLHDCDKITDVGLEHISKLSSITSLDLTACRLITDAGLQHLVTLANITSLDLCRCYNITDAGLQSVSKLEGITELNLSNCSEITDVGLEHISNLVSIVWLNLENCSKITDDGIGHVAKLSCITALNLGGCTMVADAGLERISKISTITFLNLRGCRVITDVGLEQLVKLSRIKSLNLSYCPNITDAGLEFIGKLSGITSLDLSYEKNITREGKKKLEITLPNCSIRK